VLVLLSRQHKLLTNSETKRKVRRRGTETTNTWDAYAPQSTACAAVDALVIRYLAFVICSRGIKQHFNARFDYEHEQEHEYES